MIGGLSHDANAYAALLNDAAGVDRLARFFSEGHAAVENAVERLRLRQARALLAEADDENVVGVLELVRCDSGSAELGLIVSASWRRLGIGTALLMETVAMSTQCLELRQLIAITRYENFPARRLLRRCDAAVSMLNSGILRWTLALQRPAAIAAGV